MIGKDDTTRLAASATTSATSTTRPYRHLQAALVGLSRGLFDLESESAWPLHEPRSDSPWHVFGFIDAYSTSGQDIPKVAVAVVTGEGDRGGNVFIDRSR